MTVMVVGLGLIGGSFAKAIQSKTNHTVLGVDQSKEVLDAALQSGAIDGLGEGQWEKADLTLVALYPGITVDFIEENAHRFRPGSVVMDLCGIKRCVCEPAKKALEKHGVVFIGGHPMAGREFSGFTHSLPTLFDGASMIVTPTDDVPIDVLSWVEEFFLKLGFGCITKTTPEHHDEIIAFTSQIAHIVSSAYIQNPISSIQMGFSAGSFGDMTRVAKLNEDMWTELFLHNQDYLVEQLDHFIENMASFRDCIAQGKEEQLKDMLRQGRILKENLLAPKSQSC